MTRDPFPGTVSFHQCYFYSFSFPLLVRYFWGVFGVALSLFLTDWLADWLDDWMADWVFV